MAEKTLPKILLIDTVYSDFLKSVPFDENSTYDVELRKILDYQFGTFDAYSSNLRALGWDAVDVIANHDRLQQMLEREVRATGDIWLSRNEPRDILAGQIYRANPDVIFMQDLSVTLEGNRFNPPLLAGQLSCPWPGDEIVRRYKILFSSFPHYIPRIEALGVRAVYLPLAFEPSVLSGPQSERDIERDIDISFVGGVGRDSHWTQGTDVLESVAARLRERFHWYGYGLDRLPASSALRACYRGEAWGRDMHDIYRRSKIVINRHGEVAQGYANNLRMFEATGCGALLVTEDASNLYEFFSPNEVLIYSTAQEAIARIEYFLDCNWPRGAEIAANGQRRTLRDHTYASRMAKVSEVLKEMLCQA